MYPTKNWNSDYIFKIPGNEFLKDSLKMGKDLDA